MLARPIGPFPGARLGCTISVAAFGITRVMWAMDSLLYQYKAVML